MRISMNDDYKHEAYDMLCGMPVGQVLELLTNYHGMQLFDCGFMEFLNDEGIIELVDEGEEDDNEN